MGKPSIGGILFEVLFGAALIVIGVLRPGFIFRLDFLAAIRHPLGDTGLAIVLIAGGAALIAWTLFKAIRSRGSE